MFNTVSFADLHATLETFGANFILKMSGDKELLSRAVISLYNFRAIDRIPTPGDEYEGLAPYNIGDDSVAFVQTSEKRLNAALETMAHAELFGIRNVVANKRNKNARKVRTHGDTPYRQEVKNRAKELRAQFEMADAFIRREFMPNEFSIGRI